ncbi:hypothetical protein [Paracoccus tegillarcae]|uniref:hypothetical protein n=1 Tax=Paracoccus tegillarcae TaxID=1529068 RepID=UPI001300327B|nr:hypothetical protein [Paracoccus tegillarcae]
MIARLPLRGSTPHLTLQQLIDRHGTRVVVIALIGTMIRGARKPKRRRRNAAAERLSPHLRRDIGLPPYRDDSPRHWDIRL